MKLALKQIAQASAHRPVGYLAKCLQEGKLEGGVIDFTDEAFEKVKSWVQENIGAAKGTFDSKEYREFFDQVQGGRWNLLPPGQMPSLVAMAQSAAKALAKGVNQATEEERARREAICDGCEYYTKNILGKQNTTSNHRCILCGCWMALKQRQAAGACDAGKW